MRAAIRPFVALACLPALAHAPAALAAPGLRPESVPRAPLAGDHAVEYLLGVVIVMLALGAFALVMRRLQGRMGAGRGALKVTASLPLGGKERLMIVEAEGERLLVGVGGGGVQLVRRLRAAPAADAPAAPADTWLARTLRAGAAR